MHVITIDVPCSDVQHEVMLDPSCGRQPTYTSTLRVRGAASSALAELQCVMHLCFSDSPEAFYSFRVLPHYVVEENAVVFTWFLKGLKARQSDYSAIR
jgi:hypothetical protein